MLAVTGSKHGNSFFYLAFDLVSSFRVNFGFN